MTELEYYDDEIVIYGEDIEEMTHKILNEINKTFEVIKEHPSAYTRIKSDEVQDKIWETIKDNIDYLLDYPAYQKDLKD